MMHEYRESPYSAGICAACGAPFSWCLGLKLSPLPSFLSRVDATMEAQGEWDVWCRRFGIDPNTPDETVLDDYLHGRTHGPAPGQLYAAYHGLSQVARAEVSELERWFRL